jgi:hypothetical protein
LRLRTNKFNARVMHEDGRRFDSISELKRYRELKLLERAGMITRLETQVTIPILVKGQKICDYRADFQYFNPQGTRILEDVKGYRKGSAYQIFRLKKKLIQALYNETVQEV